MRSLLALSSLALVVLCPSHAVCDVVITPTATSFGKVVSIGNGKVAFLEGCEISQRSEILLDSVLLIHFDHQCLPHDVEVPSAGLSRCEHQRKRAYRVRFNGSDSEYLALSVQFSSSGKAVMLAFDDSGALFGPSSGVFSIQPISYCPDQTAPKNEYPTAYCFETKKWAVNWSPLPVFSNQIFTRGSSIYVEKVGATSLSPDHVRDAYQTALSLWAIALQDHRNELGPDIASYVISSTSTGGRYSLFTPPQVIRMDCAASALAIVKWYSQRGDAFPSKDRLYIAKAQLDGRTILLNANDNAFRSERDYTKPLPVNEVNLVTVFVHELGHSFGLPDRYDVPSVMNPDYVADHANELVTPFAVDASAFAQILRVSISGAEPGVFNAKDCAGLRRKRVLAVSAPPSH